jgi:hypothetical protein
MLAHSHRCTHSQDLLVEHTDLVKRRSRCDAVHQKEPFTGSHCKAKDRIPQHGHPSLNPLQGSQCAKLTILFSHSTVFLLPSRVQDIEKSDLFIDKTLFTIRILDSWVVPAEMSGLTS